MELNKDQNHSTVQGLPSRFHRVFIWCVVLYPHSKLCSRLCSRTLEEHGCSGTLPSDTRGFAGTAAAALPSAQGPDPCRASCAGGRPPAPRPFARGTQAVGAPSSPHNQHLQPRSEN